MCDAGGKSLREGRRGERFNSCGSPLGQGAADLGVMVCASCFFRAYKSAITYQKCVPIWTSENGKMGLRLCRFFIGQEIVPCGLLHSFPLIDCARLHPSPPQGTKSVICLLPFGTLLRIVPALWWRFIHIVSRPCATRLPACSRNLVPASCQPRASRLGLPLRICMPYTVMFSPCP